MRNAGCSTRTLRPDHRDLENKNRRGEGNQGGNQNRGKMSYHENYGENKIPALKTNML
jgi:hypothetical protein